MILVTIKRQNFSFSSLIKLFSHKLIFSFRIVTRVRRGRKKKRERGIKIVEARGRNRWKVFEAIFLRGSRSSDGIIYNHVPSKTRKYYLTKRNFLTSLAPSSTWIHQDLYVPPKKFIFIYPPYTPLYTYFQGVGGGITRKKR